MGAAYFAAATREVAGTLRWPLRIEGDDYASEIGTAARRRAALAWGLRRVQGKLRSIARLTKALFTLEGGFDYIAWKLERHSGKPVEIPPRVRKYPLIFVWGLMWRLYRQGWRRVLWQRASGRILEMGAGTGLNQPYYPAGAEVMACDLSKGMLHKAVERARGKNVRIIFCEADICHLPFPDGAFDTTAETFVFCSLADPVPCLREMGRVTKPGGQILLLDHVRIERPLIGPLMDRLNTATVRLAGEHVTHRMDVLVRAAGLEIVESQRLGFMGIFQFIVARPGT